MKHKSEISISFGKLLKDLRKRKEISQEELAFRSNLNRTYIGMIERGEKNITLYNLYKISNGLGISLKELLSDL